jgi:hypothetical protein
MIREGESLGGEKRKKLENNFVFVFRRLELRARAVVRLESNNCRRQRIRFKIGLAKVS